VRNIGAECPLTPWSAQSIRGQGEPARRCRYGNQKEERARFREGEERALRLGGWGLSCERGNVRRMCAEGMPNLLNLKCAQLPSRSGKAEKCTQAVVQCADPCAGDDYDECDFVVGTQM